jgi:ABC-type oligopeptide transport system ATPase subunit
MPVDPERVLLRVKDLCVRFQQRGGIVNAVDGVSFQLQHGSTLGVVGESGSGKSTLGRAVLRLIPVTSGEIRFDGVDVRNASRSVMRGLRRKMQIIFQDPAGSLNPRMRVGEIVGEPLLVHPPHSHGDALRREVGSLLERCGMPRDAANRYPHEFSGGQRQRIAIARAIAQRPKLIVCDEPTSALDVSIQAQILNLLKDLQRDFGLSYLFISHDMAVIDHMCDRVAVMKGGRIIEEGECDQIMQSPQHEYTQQLLSAVPA